MIRRVAISLTRLPSAFDGTTVAAIADLHLRRGRPTAAVKQLVEAVNARRPELVVLLGDLLHRARGSAEPLAPLAGLQAPLGVYACLGNHEHGFMWYSRYLKPSAPSVEEWRARLAGLGITLLHNEARPIARGKVRLWLVGVGDAYCEHDDLAAALRGVPEDEFRLAITHSPDLLDDPKATHLDLLLAGHTHGGQVRLPGIGALWAPCRRPRRRASGLLHVGPALAYVSRGVGEGLPLRLFCPRELPLITLRPPPWVRATRH
jgi:predicted MPP superfamily phosphohydrolase